MQCIFEYTLFLWLLVATFHSRKLSIRTFVEGDDPFISRLRRSTTTLRVLTGIVLTGIVLTVNVVHSIKMNLHRGEVNIKNNKVF